MGSGRCGLVGAGGRLGNSSTRIGSRFIGAGVVAGDNLLIHSFGRGVATRASKPLGVGESRHELIEVGADGIELALGVSGGGLQLGHQRLRGGGAFHGSEGIALGGGDGGLISGVIAEGIGELLAQIRRSLRSWSTWERASSRSAATAATF